MLGVAAMTWLVVTLVVVGYPVAALLFGAESRDGRDWQSSSGLPSPLPDRDLAPSHTSGAGGSGRHAHHRERVKQA
jgi:hypothetical protein